MAIKKIVTALLISTGLLIVPFIASRFVEGWLWTGSDYLFAWVMFSFVSMALTFTLSSAQNLAYKAAAGLAVLGTFLLVWVNAAVGIIGDDNPANMLYLGVVLVGLIGIVLARLKPAGMANALFGMTLAQLAVPVIAFFVWSPAVVSWAPGVLIVFFLNAFFALLFIVSGLLFRYAAHQ